MSKLREGIRQEVKDYLRNSDIQVKLSDDLLRCLLDNLESELSERIHESVDMCIDN
jgi:hypothetical protein